MNSWNSHGRMAWDHRSELLGEAARNRMARSERKELRTVEAAPAPRWTIRKLAAALTRAFRPVH